MDFFISSFKNSLYKCTRDISQCLYISFEKNHKITQREYLYENDDLLLIADTNISFLQAIKKEKVTETLIVDNINKLKNGYILFVDKLKKSISVYNDIFGFYHLFYLNSSNQFLITSNFKNLLPFSKSSSDYFAFLDMVLFNYTLLDRTVVNDIKRIKGGSVIEIDNNSQRFNSLYNYADNFQLKKHKNINLKDIGSIINRSVSEDIADNQENFLTITGGFDSRTLLASLSNQKIKFDSLTFGQKGNIENETIQPFIRQFSNKHHFIELDNDYINNLNEVLDEYIIFNLDCPNVLDLPHYLYLRNNVPNANIITGFLFGELLSGLTTGSQVTFTSFAKSLLLAKDINNLKQPLLNQVAKLKVINESKLIEFVDDYLQTLKHYCFQENKLHILQFLLNETYSKFFGSINKVFRNHSNIIAPFIDTELINSILNSNLSFFKDNLFERKARLNFKRKTFHARLILHLSPNLASTKFDRLYRVKDLCYTHLYPLAFIGYIKSHVGKQNKINFPKPHFYDLWYKKLIIKTLRKQSLSRKHNTFFTNISEDLLTLYENAPSNEKKKFANIMSWIKAREIIKNK